MSLDPAHVTENESTEGKQKDSLKPDDFEQLETKVVSSEQLSASVNIEFRTSDLVTTIGKVVVKKNQISDVNESTNTLRASHVAQKEVRGFVVEVDKMEISEKEEIRREKCLDSDIVR